MKSPLEPRPSPAPAAEPRATVLDRIRENGQLGELLDAVELRVRQRRRKRRAALRTAAAVVLCVIGLAWLVPYFTQRATVVTESAQRRELTLADGSHVTLNANTHLQTDFRYGRRRVRLDAGQAFFAVAKDRANPFRVETPAGTIEVTGTQFDVRLGRGPGSAVTLLEGAVEVRSPGDTVTHLRPGEQLAWNGDQPHVAKLSSPQLAQVVAWRTGELILDGLTLEQVAHELSDYYGCAISVAPNVAGLRLGGRYPLSNLDQFFTGLQTMLPVKVDGNATNGYRISPK